MYNMKGLSYKCIKIMYVNEFQYVYRTNMYIEQTANEILFDFFKKNEYKETN